MILSLAKIIVARELPYPINIRETGAEQHLHQASLARIKRDVGQALVVLRRFIAHHHPRIFARRAHALNQQSLTGQRAKMPNRPHWTLKVIQQSKTQH
jgi:hypothetical protein